MIKKIALGCGLALLLTGIVAGGLAYYAYRQVSATFTQFAALAEAPELEKSVKNREVYVAPASEEITEAQIEKLVKVQADVRQRLGERIAAFEKQYKALVDKKEASITDGPKILQAYADLASTWIDAKRAQVEALNATNLSLEDIRWIRDQAYRALGQPFVDMDLSKIMENATERCAVGYRRAAWLTRPRGSGGKPGPHRQVQEAAPGQSRAGIVRPVTEDGKGKMDNRDCAEHPEKH